MINLDEKLAMAARHQQEGRLAQAARLYQEVLAEDPGQPDALQQGNGERALELAPGNADLAFKRATALLLLGRYEEGFADYPARRALPDMAQRLPRIPAPRWDGDDPSGKTVLLHGDGSLAETLLLLRYLPLLREKRVRVKRQRREMPSSPSRATTCMPSQGVPSNIPRVATTAVVLAMGYTS